MFKQFLNKLIIFIFLVIFVFSCAAPRIVEVPVEKVKTEYQDKFIKDSIYVHDSVVLKQTDDTVYKITYKYRYRDKIITDTVIKNDTITVVQQVIKYKNVYKLHKWQEFMIAMGLLSILVLVYKITK